MLDWEDIQQTHVIRKLRTILGQWFKVDLFFIDASGQIKNIDFRDSKKEYKNALSQHLMSREFSREWLSRYFIEQTPLLSQAPELTLHRVGPLGFETVYFAKVMIQKEYQGTIAAFCLAAIDAPEDLLQAARLRVVTAGGNADSFNLSIKSLKVLDKSEQKYSEELIDLVAQEVVTFHTEIAKRESRITELNQQLETRYSYHQMIGKSKPMQDLYEVLDKIASSEATVLIQGENGTGKELIAKSIHYSSPRKDKAFITVNCSAFNENLLDSELFGHVKGAFTGAIKDKKGLFEAADEGTLFLDEIGDMSPSMQVKLLRVLQQGTLTPVGGTDERKVDVRVIAATHRDLKSMIEQGTFREDLYYRIHVINLSLPALRQRKDDIPLLVEHFLKKGCDSKKLPQKVLHQKSLEKFFEYPWPGNIRELENEIERLIVLSGNDKEIPVDLVSQRILAGVSGTGPLKSLGLDLNGKLKDAIEELEKKMILEGLKRTKWNKSRLSKELGISRAGLIMKGEKYGLDKRKMARDDQAA